jgi:hypothetical protein
VKPWERWTFGVLVSIVSATGAAYFWMKYLLASDDPFAVVNHPWEGAMLAAHVVAAPWLLLMFGLVLNSHILRKLGVGARLPNRKSGYLSLATFFLMTASGYLLQVVTGDLALQLLVALHVATGTVFALSYATHLVISARLARAYRQTRARLEAV